MPAIIPPEDTRRGIPLHTFVPELDKDYPRPINNIYVGTTGDLAVENIEGDPNKYFAEKRGVLDPDNITQKHSVT